jgi:hypothetical protein
VAHPLFDVDHLASDVERCLVDIGEVFAEFRRQDSGCHALGVALGEERWFVRFSVEPARCLRWSVPSPCTGRSRTRP